jgi:hypothetical protein
MPVISIDVVPVTNEDCDPTARTSADRPIRTVPALPEIPSPLTEAFADRVISTPDRALEIWRPETSAAFESPTVTAPEAD